MISTQSKNSQSIEYPSRTVARAERAMRCSPFRLYLFVCMGSTSVPIQAIASDSGVQHNYTKRPLSELGAENALVWLIQVGILRREVDGQGITDSFRLTPLGRQLVEKYEPNGGIIPAPSLLDLLSNTLTRWLRLPF
ncbi:Npun_F0494 family protein [Crinalium epipsammum]|nr:Npun_F0494 family protein [Crinalium epipsammum]